MSEPTLRDHALRVGVLKVIADESAKLYKGARADAEQAFAPARADGQSQQKVLLPDGAEVGLISISAGGRQVDVTGAALEAWCDAHLPGAFEEYADMITDAEVLDVLRAVFPDLVKRRIRHATRAALMSEVEESGGYLVDQAEGTKEKVGEVTDLKPSGAFSYRPGPDAREKVIAAWQRGELQGIGLGALALPGAAAESDEPAADGGMPFGPFGDDLGLLDPVRAAMYATVMSDGKGFTTPPVEAYRMLRDGGVHEVRARAWMAAHGLDPADPREGEGTPWPLPGAAA